MAKNINFNEIYDFCTIITHQNINDKDSHSITCYNTIDHVKSSRFIENLTNKVFAHFKAEEKINPAVEFRYAATHIANEGVDHMFLEELKERFPERDEIATNCFQSSNFQLKGDYSSLFSNYSNTIALDWDLYMDIRY
jgi:hypothetical protein